MCSATHEIQQEFGLQAILQNVLGRITMLIFKLWASHISLYFAAMQADTLHVLHQLLPPVAPRTYNIRPRAQKFLIPQQTSSLADKNFLNIIVFETFLYIIFLNII